MKSHILNKYHIELGHIGRDIMIDAILKTYWIKNMKEKCSSHIENRSTKEG